MSAARVVCEVCTEGLEGALAATAGGADRIELCAALSEGGLTPSLGTIEAVRARCPLDVMVLVRPRAGDFVYSADELDVVRRDIARCKELGVRGVVVGALRPDGDVDEDATAALLEAARPLEVTFHRAFDMARDPFAALEALASLGVDRILTSGQRPRALEALDLLAELVRRAGDRLTVMPGGLASPQDAATVVERTGCREIHFAALSRGPSPMRHRNEAVRMGALAPPGEYERVHTDAGRVRAFVRAARPEARGTD